MHNAPLQNAPVLYQAPKHERTLMHSLKRVWVGLMLLRGAKRARRIASAPTPDDVDRAA